MGTDNSRNNYNKYHIKNMNKKYFVIVALFILLLGFVAWKLLESHSNSKTIVVSYENTYTRTVINVMKEKKILEKYLPRGTDIKWVMIDNSADLRDALATNRVSLGALNNVRAISAIENNYPISILANGPGLSMAVYTANSGINKPEDLANFKKVAVYGTGRMALQKNLRTNYGFTLRDDQLAEISESDMINMLPRGQIDAALLTDTYATRCKELNIEIYKIVDVTPEIIELGMTNWLVASSKFIEENQELVDPIMSAYREATNWINANPKEAADLLAPLYRVDSSEIEREIKAFPPTIEVYGYDNLANFMYEQGELEKKPRLFSDLPNYETIPKK